MTRNARSGAVVIGAMALFVASALAMRQPATTTPPGKQESTRQPGEGRGGEGRQPGRREGGPREGGPGGGQASAEGAMKSMNRALRTLKDQVRMPEKKAENLQLINDMQRGCITAKGLKPEHGFEGLATQADKDARLLKYRTEMIALARVLLDVEADLLADRFDQAKANLDKALDMRDKSHKEYGIED